tara:strand:+ start:7343 stop:7975 length:633 start_codon:yes stop_codon:yes gene_type:complete
MRGAAMICVVDYGRGNLFSIGRALDVLGLDYFVSHDPDAVAASSRVILPGVGAFGDAMAKIRELDMLDPLHEIARRGDQIVGICLGAQMLATRSLEFGDHAGLDLIPGEVRRLPDPVDPSGTRIPNIGWRCVEACNGYDMLGQLGHEPYFYFVHSFGVQCADPIDVLGSIIVNGEEIPAIIGCDNIYGFQFHPEKSGAVGLSLLAKTFGI